MRWFFEGRVFWGAWVMASVVFCDDGDDGGSARGGCMIFWEAGIRLGGGLAFER